MFDRAPSNSGRHRKWRRSGVDRLKRIVVNVLSLFTGMVAGLASFALNSESGHLAATVVQALASTLFVSTTLESVLSRWFCGLELDGSPRE